MLNSLRNRIILAFGLVIVAAVLMTSLVALRSADRQLEGFISDINLRQASGLVGIVEVEYNLQGNLDSLSRTLKAQSLASPRKALLIPAYDPEAWQAITAQYGQATARSVGAIMHAEIERVGDALGFSDIVERWYQAQAFVYGQSNPKDLTFDASAVYLLDANFSIRYAGHDDGFEAGHGEEEEEHTEEEHHFSMPFYDWSDGSLVGYVVTEGAEEFSDESRAFAQGTFTHSLYGGLITMLFALGLGIWLASRINAPVKALTQAATRLAESGDTERIEVQSDDELGEMSRAFNRMAEAIRAQQQIRQQLIADISHELNTPLSIMLLEARGMIDGMQTPQEAAANIQREIKLLRGLITDLEWIAEADNKAIQLDKEPVGVADFLATVLERWRSKASAQGIQLQRELEALLPTVVFDRNRMRQVLDNLLRNALQHTEQGGQVTVSARVTASHLIIAISDSGCGIAAEHLPRLFERFYRCDESPEHLSSGRGLGLAIVKQLVELHEGQVSVTSEPGVGSTFSVSIPRSSTLEGRRALG